MMKKTIMTKSNKILLCILLPAVFLLLLAVLFSNKLFYTEKTYSDKVVVKTINTVNNFFKSTRNSSSKNLEFLQLKENKTYTVSLDIDKRYAFENNFPYFEGLKMTVDTFLENEKAYSSIKINDNSKSILEVDTYSDESQDVISMPSIFDGYYHPLDGYIEYDNENDDYDEEDYEATDDEEDYDDENETITTFSESPSMFSVIANYSGLTADETTELTVMLLKDIIYSLPESCYNTKIGIGERSEIMISVSEKELSFALANAFEKNKDNENFKAVITELFLVEDYDTYIKDVINDLRKLKASQYNYYTISMKTNVFGTIKTISLSTLIDNEYNSCDLSISKGKITGILKNNEKFSSNIQEYTVSSFEIVYGVKSDKTLKGYFKVVVDGGSFLLHFDNIAFTNNLISGDVLIDVKNGNKVQISLNSNDKMLEAAYIDSNNKNLLKLSYSIEDNNVAPFDLNKIKSGQRYFNPDNYINAVIDSENYNKFLEDIQYEQFKYWFDSLVDLYLPEETK